jgi:hypothetical protein
MMKNIKLNFTKLLMVMSLLFIPSGCEEYLDEEFKSGLSPSTFYNTDSEAQIAVDGAYSILTGAGWFQHRDRPAWWQIAADEISSTRNIFKEAHNITYNEGVADGERYWRTLYEAVRNTSDAITNISGNQNLTQSAIDQSLGQLYVIRALAYYDLTAVWGDVPFFTELLSPEELSSLERTPKKTIRDAMISDLQTAYGLLPDSWTGTDSGRMSKWAAKALEAKFHMFSKNWQGMLTACQDIINNSPHRLMDNFSDVYNWTNAGYTGKVKPEHILWIDFTGIPAKGLNTNGDHNYQRGHDFVPRLRDEPKDKKGRQNELKAALKANGHEFGGYGGGSPLPLLADRSSWDTGDLRYDETVTGEYEGIPLKFKYLKKLWNLSLTFSPRLNKSENFVMIRLADIYLMAGEAENELNGPGNAYQYVNKVRERAFEPDQPWSGLSQQEFREEMYEERLHELCGEQHRKPDLVRWGIYVERVQNTTFQKHNKPAATNVQEKHNYAPIPLSEIQLNPNLLNTDPTNNGYR